MRFSSYSDMPLISFKLGGPLSSADHCDRSSSTLMSRLEVRVTLKPTSSIALAMASSRPNLPPSYLAVSVVLGCSGTSTDPTSSPESLGPSEITALRTAPMHVTQVSPSRASSSNGDLLLIAHSIGTSCTVVVAWYPVFQKWNSLVRLKQIPGNRFHFQSRLAT